MTGVSFSKWFSHPRCTGLGGYTAEKGNFRAISSSVDKGIELLISFVLSIIIN